MFWRLRQNNFARSRPGCAMKGAEMLNRLTDALNFQTQALTLRAERQRLLAATGRQLADDDGHTGLAGAGVGDVREVGAGRGIRRVNLTNDAGG